MKNYKKIDSRTVRRYECLNHPGYIVEVYKDYDERANEEVYGAWLYKRHNGTKEFIIGELVSYGRSLAEFADSVLSDIEADIDLYDFSNEVDEEAFSNMADDAFYEWKKANGRKV